MSGISFNLHQYIVYQCYDRHQPLFTHLSILAFSIAGNGLGLKVVGGHEIPGSNMIGAYIQKIHPSLTMMGEIREGITYSIIASLRPLVPHKSDCTVKESFGLN